VILSSKNSKGTNPTNTNIDKPTTGQDKVSKTPDKIENDSGFFKKVM
jgi:hypothetical protein